MAELPNGGLDEDGILPVTCPEGAGSLTASCLRYGYNLRNLLTLQALEQLRVNLLSVPAERLVTSMSTGRCPDLLLDISRVSRRLSRAGGIAIPRDVPPAATIARSAPDRAMLRCFLADPFS